jgi:hypothetical protein
MTFSEKLESIIDKRIRLLKIDIEDPNVPMDLINTKIRQVDLLEEFKEALFS